MTSLVDTASQMKDNTRPVYLYEIKSVESLNDFLNIGEE